MTSKLLNLMVGTGRFELPTPRTPSECSTRLSHVPTTVRQGSYCEECIKSRSPDAHSYWAGLKPGRMRDSDLNMW